MRMREASSPLGHIADIMHLVFYPPITSNALSKGFRRFQKQGAIVAGLGFETRLSALLEVAFTLYSNDRLQAWPGFDALQGGAEADDPLLKSPMALTDLGVACLGDKVGLDGFEEVALIALEGTQVVIPGVNNELTGFFCVLMASKAITTPLSASCSINSGKALISLVLRST